MKNQALTKDAVRILKGYVSNIIALSLCDAKKININDDGWHPRLVNELLTTLLNKGLFIRTKLCVEKLGRETMVLTEDHTEVYRSLVTVALVAGKVTRLTLNNINPNALFMSQEEWSDVLGYPISLDMSISRMNPLTGDTVATFHNINRPIEDCHKC